MADERLNGSEYRALRRLSTKDNVTVAEIGETCERVPVESLPSLLASGKIEPIDPASPAAVPPRVAPERRVTARHPAATPRRRQDEV